MKAIIVEDDLSVALDYEMVLDRMGIELLGVFNNADSCLSFLKKNKPDFIILDLHLEGKEGGLSLARKVQHYFIPIIVVTGYPLSELMNEAKELKAEAFLVKPINNLTLEFEIKKIAENKSNADENAFFTVKERGAYIKIPNDEVQYIEIEGNYSTIYTKKKKFVLKKSLTKVWQNLNREVYMRVHRGFIINVKYIDSVDFPRKELKLTDNLKLRIGKSYFPDLKQLMDSRNLV